MKATLILGLFTVVGLVQVVPLFLPAQHARMERREDPVASCPGVMRGPSGNAYFGMPHGCGCHE